MKAIVGLGNPGPRYAGTRHNVGFEVVTRLAQQWGIRLKPSHCRSHAGEGMMGTQPVGLALPQTSMNASGQAVGCLLRRWKLERAQLLVVCDDLSLPLGMIRLRPKGSEGGHKGLASVLEETQTQEIPRLRVGISGKNIGARPGLGPTGRAGEDLTAFVLGRWKAAEKKPLGKGLDLAVKACEVWFARGISEAMNQFNSRRKE